VFIADKFTRRGLLSALAAVPAARLLAAQDLPTLKRAPQSSSEGEEKPKLAEARMINVFATVKDKSSGKLVKDLTQDDFTLEEESKPQTIKFFEAQASGPLSLGILVDTSYQQSRSLADERTNAIKFVDQILRDKDQGFVIHFDKDIELLQDFTNSHDKLDRALNLLEPAQPPQQQQQTQQQGGGYPGGGGGYPGGGRQRYPQGGGFRRGVTKIYDAILLASDELMSKQQGHKAVVLFSDGVDSGSKTTLFEAISSAQKADTTIHTVLLADDQQSSYGNPGYGGMGRRGGGRMPPPSGSQGPDGKKILQQIAEETGGSFSSVGSFHHLDKIFADLQEELRSRYNLGYVPDPLSEVGLFRHIHLTAKLKKKDLVVQVRSGYYVR
jgi:VWFA-related protein